MTPWKVGKSLPFKFWKFCRNISVDFNLIIEKLHFDHGTFYFEPAFSWIAATDVYCVAKKWPTLQYLAFLYSTVIRPFHWYVVHSIVIVLDTKCMHNLLLRPNYVPTLPENTLSRPLNTVSREMVIRVLMHCCRSNKMGGNQSKIQIELEVSRSYSKVDILLYYGRGRL